MTIRLGSAVLSGTSVTIQPPSGFNAVGAVRLTNYTGEVLTLDNITGEDPSLEYLMPLQQMVYHTKNVSKVPVILGLVLGAGFPLAQLFVEWSDNPLEDFPGTYPAQITQVDAFATALKTATLALPLVGTTYSIAADPQRDSLTIVNAGSTDVEWHQSDAGWGTNPVIVPTSGRSVGSGSSPFKGAVYFRTHAVNGLLEWFSD